MLRQHASHNVQKSKAGSTVRGFAIAGAHRKDSISGRASPDRAGAAVGRQLGGDFVRVPVHDDGAAARSEAPLAPMALPQSARRRTLDAYGIQTKLAVSDPDDAYEQEADRIAASLVGESSGHCSNCLARYTAVPPSEGSPQLSDQTVAQINSLRGRGAPLPASSRSFFEPRLAADLGRVRIHTDDESARMADAVDAVAFTVGTDIVFGHGAYAPETSSGRRLLAHELVHVLQQNRQPPPPRVQRLAYWTETSARPGSMRPRGGTSVHAEILPTLRASAGPLFTEAPVPQASRHGAGVEGQRGYADLYVASTTVGIEFPAHDTVHALPSGTGLERDGQRYAHRTNAAPQVDAIGRITRVAHAPTAIAVGDLKGGFESITAAGGPSQLDHYLDGFRTAAREYNEYAARHPTRVPAGAPPWTVAGRKLGRNEIRIPPQYEIANAASQPSKRLILVGAAGAVERDFSVRHRVMGKLYVFPDASRDGIWIYLWAPDAAVPLASLPAGVQALGDDVTRLLVQPLLSTPIRLSRTARVRPAPNHRPRPQDAAPRDRIRVSRVRTPVVARRLRALPDPFNHAIWQRDQELLSARATDAGRDPGFQDAAVADKVEEANALARQHGLRIPALPEARRQDARIVRRIDLWTGPSGRILGDFRRVFGATFARMATLYIRLQERVRALLRPREGTRRGFGGGLLGAALKAGYSVIKAAARFVVARTFARLADSLRTGTERKLQALISPERIEDVQTRVNEVRQLQANLEARGIAAIENAFGPEVIRHYEATFESIENVQRVIGDVSALVNLVRWGARVLACLSPPAVGCLWALTQAVLEAVAARVVETCWFQKKIGPLIGRVAFIRQLPTTLAAGIVDRIRPLLPAGLRDIVAEVDNTAVPVSASDIDCDESSDGADRFTDERRARGELIEAVGMERWDALNQGMRQAGVPAERVLTADDHRQARDAILRTGVTAAQLSAHRGQGVAALGPIDEFIRSLRRPGSGGQAAPIEAQPSSHAPATGPRTEFPVSVTGTSGLREPRGTMTRVTLTLRIEEHLVTLRNVPVRIDERRPETGGASSVKLVLTEAVTFDLSEYQSRGVLPFGILTLDAGAHVWYTPRAAATPSQVPAQTPRQ